MVCWMIDKYGTEDQRSTFIPMLASMQKLGAYCLTEPGAGSDAASLATVAKRDGAKFIVNGSKAFISAGGDADVYLVIINSCEPAVVYMLFFGSLIWWYCQINAPGEQVGVFI